MTKAADLCEEQFFEQGDQPLFEAEPEAEPTLAVVAPSVNERRARLRRVVGVALTASVALFALGLLRHESAARPWPAASGPARRVTLAALQPSPLAAPPSSERSAPPAPVAAAPSSGAPALDPQALIRSARRLLEAGRTRDGVALARAAVSANPKNAEPYILLAAGLQDLGRWAEARSVFASCKQATSRGPNATCRYFAGL